MSMASPWVWSPKAGVAGIPLRDSTASFSFRRTGRSWMIHRPPRSSLHGPPPPPPPPTASSPSVEPTNEKPGAAIHLPADPPAADGRQLRAPARIRRSDGAGLLQESRATISSASPGSPGRRPRPAPRSMSFRGRPLWKRILFASTKVRAIILLNVVTIVYASNIPVVKEVEAIMDPALFTVVRFTVSAIPFLPFILQARGDSRTRSSGIELGFWLSLGYLSQSLGLLTSDAGRASFISAFTVIVVPLIDGIFGATVPALTWSGAFISLIGVAMLEWGGSPESPPSVGDILNLLSAVFFGIHMLRTEHISRNTKREKFLALLGYEIWIVALSSAVWFLFRDVFGDTNQLGFGSWSWSKCWDGMVSFPWVPALYTGVLSTAFCLWVEMDAMRNVSATETAIIYGLEPVWGAAFAWCLLGERWGTSEWIGAALVLCGSLTVQLLGSHPKKSENGQESSKHDYVNGSDKQNNLSLSTVVINPQKNAADLIRKKDKL